MFVFVFFGERKTVRGVKKVGGWILQTCFADGTCSDINPGRFNIDYLLGSVPIPVPIVLSINTPLAKV